MMPSSEILIDVRKGRVRKATRPPSKLHRRSKCESYDDADASVLSETSRLKDDNEREEVCKDDNGKENTNQENKPRHGVSAKVQLFSKSLMAEMLLKRKVLRKVSDCTDKDVANSIPAGSTSSSEPNLTTDDQECTPLEDNKPAHIDFDGVTDDEEIISEAHANSLSYCKAETTSKVPCNEVTDIDVQRGVLTTVGEPDEPPVEIKRFDNMHATMFRKPNLQHLEIPTSEEGEDAEEEDSLDSVEMLVEQPPWQAEWESKRKKVTDFQQMTDVSFTTSPQPQELLDMRCSGK